MGNGEPIIVNNALFPFGPCADLTEQDSIKGWRIKAEETVFIPAPSTAPGTGRGLTPAESKSQLRREFGFCFAFSPFTLHLL